MARSHGVADKCTCTEKEVDLRGWGAMWSIWSQHTGQARRPSCSVSAERSSLAAVSRAGALSSLGPKEVFMLPRVITGCQRNP